jgi:hypothetical protein
MKLQKFEMRPDWEPTLGTSLERQRSLLNPGGFIGSITATSGPQKFETCPDWGATNRRVEIKALQFQLSSQLLENVVRIQDGTACL